MKYKLLFLCFITFSFVALSQNGIAPPEPCGKSPYYLCDENEDDIEVFNLVEFYPFNFCGVPPNATPMDYHPTTFHLTLEEAQNGVNAIPNPESYTNIINPQEIYMRAEPIVPETSKVLIYSDKIEASLTADSDRDGLTDCEETLGIDDLNTPLDPITFGVNPSNPSNPRSACDPIDIRTRDRDADGLTDCEEITGNNSIHTVCEPEGNITNPVIRNITCENKEIRVYAFLDFNSNGIFDKDEQLISSSGSYTYELNDDGIERNVSSSGDYITILDDLLSNSYDITFNFNDGSNCYMPSNDLENLLITLGSIGDYYIPITTISCRDISLSMRSYRAPRPGFNYLNFLYIRNSGSIPTSGSVEFIYDSLIEFIEVQGKSSTSSITLTPTGFILNFANLQPFRSESVSIWMHVPPSVSLGEVITNKATYNATPSEVDTSNDSAALTEVVIGSYDPNDKMEAHGEDILYDDFITSNGYLYYTVRFQNVGTAEAITVRIEDTLDVLLDASTFEMIQSSHDYQVNREVNQLTWTFNNINLPAESQDAEGSNGFVHFKIKPLPGYMVGTVIPAKAEIYFDFNAPVITNTFETNFIEENLSVDVTEFKAFTLYPNPAKETVNINLNNKGLNDNAKIEIYDLSGRIVLEKAVKTNVAIKINVNHLNTGVYMLKLKSEFNTSVKKLIIRK